MFCGSCCGLCCGSRCLFCGSHCGLRFFQRIVNSNAVAFHSVVSVFRILFHIVRQDRSICDFKRQRLFDNIILLSVRAVFHREFRQLIFSFQQLFYLPRIPVRDPFQFLSVHHNYVSISILYLQHRTENTFILNTVFLYFD